MWSASLFEFLKPYLWLALAAFLTGFLCYLAVGRPTAAQATVEARAPLVSGPASDEWNLPKHI